jgi:hypothetical protein
VLRRTLCAPSLFIRHGSTMKFRGSLTTTIDPTFRFDHRSLTRRKARAESASTTFTDTVRILLTKPPLARR